MAVNGCVEPYNLRSSSFTEKLTVDGEITDQPGPYKVKLVYSKSVLSTDDSDTRAATGAEVWIEDNGGIKELLTEAEDGVYVTSSIQGQAGKSYKINITTSNGKHYESLWEPLESAGVIQNFYYTFKEDLITPLEGEKYDYLDGFNFFVDASSDAESSGLLRWRWTGIFKIISEPERNTKFVGRAELPDPLPCSGYIIGSRGLTQVSECTCCICWGYEYGRNVIVSDNINTASNNFKDVLVGQVLISKPRFHERYYVQLEQLSVSESVYEFWKLIGEQQKATGNLFQSNAVKIKGNIISLTDSEEEVLGVFSASSIVKASFSLDKSNIPFEVAPMNRAPSDCRKSVINGTTSKPEFW